MVQDGPGRDVAALALPVNPMAIETTVSRRGYWWVSAEEDDQPREWNASADVSCVHPCPEQGRHIADIALTLAELTTERDLRGVVPLAEWAFQFLSEIVADPITGRLEPGLDEQFEPGPPRIVVIRRMEVAQPWRGRGLGPLTLATALRMFAPEARLAACLVPPDEDASLREPRPIAAARADRVLRSVGFRPWNGVHVVGLRDPALLDSRQAVLDRWAAPQNSVTEDA